MKDEREIHVNDEEQQQEASPEEQAEEVAAEVADEARNGAPDRSDTDAELAELRKKAKENEDRFLRTAAEFENYKKRMSRQYEDVVRTANDKILLDLLEVVDNFERALQHDNDDDDPSPLRKGTEMIYSQLQSLLQKHGVTPIEAVGKPFDANLHEAMMEMASDEYDAGVVAMEMARGYMHNDRVLRHSKVGVSKGPADQDSE